MPSPHGTHSSSCVLTPCVYTPVPHRRPLLHSSRGRAAAADDPPNPCSAMAATALHHLDLYPLRKSDPHEGLLRILNNHSRRSESISQHYLQTPAALALLVVPTSIDSIVVFVMGRMVVRRVVDDDE